MTDSFTKIFRGLDWSVLTRMATYVIPALICITFHEFCHGLAAYALGDRTAKNAGRLTLNPIRHIDPWGLIMMVAFGFGWAKPVPVNMRSFKNPKRGMALTALAGPASNVLLAAALLFVRGLITRSAGETVLEIFDITAYLSLCLGIFNLIPIPPLDGSRLLSAFLPDDKYYALMRYERYGVILMFALVATGILGTPLTNAVGFLYRRVLGYCLLGGFNLAGAFMG